MRPCIFVASHVLSLSLSLLLYVKPPPLIFCLKKAKDSLIASCVWIYIAIDSLSLSVLGRASLNSPNGCDLFPRSRETANPHDLMQGERKVAREKTRKQLLSLAFFLPWTRS